MFKLAIAGLLDFALAAVTIILAAPGAHLLVAGVWLAWLLLIVLTIVAIKD